MDGTTVMTLGRLGRAGLQPQLQYNPFPLPRTASPSQQQNLPRPTLQNGPTAFGRIGRTIEISSLGNLGKVARALGVAPGQEEVIPQLQEQGQLMEQNQDPYVPETPQQIERQTRSNMVEAALAWNRLSWYLAPVSAAASAYHGYRRNDSVGWAAVWGLMGGLFPLMTPAVGAAQGWGKRKR